MNIYKQINELKKISDIFAECGINDVFTNSKMYEVIIAEQFGHELINGHANTPDARNCFGEIFEYKHFKISSSNHTWTFNDFSDNTIEKLNDISYVIFAIIDDTVKVPYVYKAYLVPANEVSNYLMCATTNIENTRDMINISQRQIEVNMNYNIVEIDEIVHSKLVMHAFEIIEKIEVITEINGLLTSNKFWELLVALELGHKINPEQKHHDAFDKFGNTYEYKVSAEKHSWTFQDISDNVLNSYLSDNKIVLAIVDKKQFVVEKIYVCEPAAVVRVLRYKLKNKLEKREHITRLSVGFAKRDLMELIDDGEAECVL